MLDFFDGIFLFRSSTYRRRSAKLHSRPRSNFPTPRTCTASSRYDGPLDPPPDWCFPDKNSWERALLCGNSYLAEYSTSVVEVKNQTSHHQVDEQQMEKGLVAENKNNNLHLLAPRGPGPDPLFLNEDALLQPAKSEIEQDRVPHSSQPDPIVPNLLPTGWRLAVVILPLCIGTLLVAIDNTIIGVAIPQISTVFKALDDVGWYGSAYLLTETALQPTFGNIYKYFNIKAVYLISVIIFESKTFDLYAIVASCANRELV